VPTYHVENFGCRATQADGAALERQFEERGLDHAPSEHADVVVLNTCTVTVAADQDARAAVRRIQRQNPKAKIVVTGCYAQRAPAEVAALPGVTAVVGNSHKHRLADLALLRDFPENALIEPDGDASGETLAGGFVPLAALNHESGDQGLAAEIFVSNIFAHTELLAAPVFDGKDTGRHGEQRTRPNLKVQDGCDNRCSFCVIPYVRGQSRSLSPEDVLRQVDRLVAAGFREVVISGINLGRWGRDLASDGVWKLSFEGLVRAILNHTALEKLRISSVEPMDWSDELIRLVAGSPRVAKHAHVPLQSGSDSVLRRMHRKYRPWHYREKIEKIRAAMPTAAIGADVMVGFPGETDAEFNATRRFIEDLPFTYLHVFTYSARPGTPAASMPDRVPVHVARERNRILREIAQVKKLRFMRSFVGHRVEAITLGAGGSEHHGEMFTEALTDNYLRLNLMGHHPSNRWMKVEVTEVEENALVGEAR
jgi:threonylcarbamoyladenosine tRNA methylthiotransferase MtaB